MISFRSLIPLALVVIRAQVSASAYSEQAHAEGSGFGLYGGVFKSDQETYEHVAKCKKIDAMAYAPLIGSQPAWFARRLLRNILGALEL
jgi:hypothetical protein